MKRFVRVVKWTAIGGVTVIAILLVLNAYIVWSTGTMLERRLSALRQAGDPVQLGDLAHEPIPPEQNADVFLRRAASDLEAIHKELAASYPRMGYPTGTLAPAEQDKLARLFAAYPQVMPMLEQAAACPASDPQLDVSLPPSRFLQPYMDYTTRHRLLYRVLRARSQLYLAQGRGDDALATQILMLRLTQKWRHDPLTMGYLVAMVCKQNAIDQANRILQSGPVSPQSRAALDVELALCDNMESYDWALRSERAYSLSSHRELPGSGLWLTRAVMQDTALALIGLFDRYLELGSRPFAEAASAGPAVSTAGLNPYRNLVIMLEPALKALREPAERVRAMSRSVRVLNALQARVPPGSDLVPDLATLGLPSGATIDPFSGQPLRVKKSPQGWTVYSVGSNLIDDGGLFDGKSDIGAGPLAPEKEQK